MAAYPAPPGTGPEGRYCRTCGFRCRLYRFSGNPKRTYLKCACVEWTHGPGTDIKAKSPACRYYIEGECNKVASGQDYEELKKRAQKLMLQRWNEAWGREPEKESASHV